MNNCKEMRTHTHTRTHAHTHIHTLIHTHTHTHTHTQTHNIYKTLNVKLITDNRIVWATA